MYREIITVCSEIHTKHINTLCGQNLELLSVKLAVHIVTTGLHRTICSKLSSNTKTPSPYQYPALLAPVHSPLFTFVSHPLHSFLSILIHSFPLATFPTISQFTFSLLSFLRKKKSVFRPDLTVGHACHLSSMSPSKLAIGYSSS